MFNHSIDAKAIPPLRCEIIDNVTLLPVVGDVVGPTYKYALDAYANGSPIPQARRFTLPDPNYLCLPAIKAWHTSSQEVIYGGLFHTHWGHFLLENLQRLWYAKNHNLPIVWCCNTSSFCAPSQFRAWQSELFNALGIYNKHIFLTEPTQFAKVHFPEPGTSINLYVHPEHVKFLGFYESKPIPGKYVYFSRSKVRSCTNEDLIDALLKKRGWTIIYPETLSVTQQLKALNSAEVCFMIGGSAQHSLLLTKNLQTRFIIVPRQHTSTFNIIANLTSDNYFLFHLKKTVLYSNTHNEANDSFTLDLDILEQTLITTHNFTKNLETLPELFTKPEKLLQAQVQVPQAYYAQPAPIPQAHKLFYHAYFLYQQKKYRTAAKIFQHLLKKDLLEDFMFLDCYDSMQQYHLQENVGITLPLMRHRHYVQHLQNKIIHEPLHTDSYKKLTELLLIAGNITEALEVQEQLHRLAPHWSDPLAKIAFIYHTQQQWDKVIEYAQKAVDVEPHKLQRRAELAQYLLETKDFAACKKLMTESILQYPTWDEGYTYLARVHHAQGALDKAITCVQKAIDLVPDNLSTQEILATYLHQQGNADAAVQILAQTLQHNPRAAERYAQNARVYAHMGELDKAIEYGRQAVAVEPRNFVCKTHLATYLRKNKNYAEAIELMTEAMHMNPFWSEPHAQFAAIHYEQGNLPAAIDCARKAVAVEPYDPMRSYELKAYRVEKMQRRAQDGDPLADIALKYTTTWVRIQSYIDIFYAKTYLEIGVARGDTFLNMEVPFKVGVDPEFRFDTKPFATDAVHFYDESSDTFFEHLPQRAGTWSEMYHNKPFKFDVIFIDGLHTFEQTLRDFENSIAYSHDKTVWIFDDTVPSQHFSAINCQEKHDNWKACAGLSQDSAWHGDVFKAIFAIHDSYPEFSYCTQVNNGNPQTILWRTQEPTPRKKVFGSHNAIASMRYEDFVEYAWVMHPVNDEEVLSKVFTNIDPINFRTGEEYKKVITPIISDKEREYKKQNQDLEQRLFEVAKSQKLATQEILQLKQELLELSKRNMALQTENDTLKKFVAKKG